MTGYRYTHEEDEILKTWYPKEGLPGAMVKLQLAGYSRTRSSVNQRAHVLKLKSPYCLRNFPAGTIFFGPDAKWYPVYEKTKELIAQGVPVGVACRRTGVERNRYYRMRKMEEGK
jgi:hypothetical protein